MGLYKNFVSQTRKPEGALGKVMLNGMNSGHAKMADWGFSHLPDITPTEVTDLGCGGGRNAGELRFLLKKQGIITRTKLRPDGVRSCRAMCQT